MPIPESEIDLPEYASINAKRPVFQTSACLCVKIPTVEIVKDCHFPQ